MKGVSTVIAIILILMITVALAALAYTWFTGIFASLTASATTATTTATTAMATSFVIESAWNVSTLVNVAIRNTGTSNINMPKIIAYVSDIKYTPANLNPTTTLSPGDKGTFTLTVTDPKGKTLIVSIESGLQQSATITG